MALRLQIVSRQHQSLGERAKKDFGRDGGTIGRSLESDWVLPDGQRYLSSRHASIDYRSGSYYIVDTSTNGVYVNDSEKPVGRGNPQRLFDGDRVRIGEYEMSVEIEGEEDDAEPLGDNGHIDPVELAQRVPPPDPTRGDLVQAHEITAGSIEMLLSEEAEIGALQKAATLAAANLRLEDEPPSRPPRAAGPASPPPPTVSAAQHLAPNPPSPAPSEAAAAERRVGPASPSLDAFFRGAGVPAQKLNDKQAEQLLLRLGQIMREVIVGLSENLHLRAEQKNVLRVPNTTIQPQANNPLKFSANVEESLTNLLLRRSNEYLPPVEAVREAFGDIKQHQQSVLGAMRTAVSDYIGRLDPDELESKYTAGKRGGLMSATNKLKYWDLYKDLYQLVTQAGPGQLPQQLLEDMARAYEEAGNRAAGGKPAAKAS